MQKGHWCCSGAHRLWTVRGYLIQLLWSLRDKQKRRGQYHFNIMGVSRSPEQKCNTVNAYHCQTIHCLSVLYACMNSVFSFKCVLPSLLCLPSVLFILYIRMCISTYLFRVFQNIVSGLCRWHAHLNVDILIMLLSMRPYFGLHVQRKQYQIALQQAQGKKNTMAYKMLIIARQIVN